MNIRNRLILSLLVAYSGIAAAAPTVEEQEEPVDWYDVEIIIFRHHDLKALSQENWARDPGSPMIRSARELLPSLPENLTAAHSDKLKGPLPYIQLRRDESRLEEKLALLKKSSSYEPLIHLAWRQPGLGEEDAETIHIHEGVNWPEAITSEAETSGTPNSVEDSVVVVPVEGEDLEGPPAPFIDGTIKLVRKRFLHVEADFIYRAPYIEDKDNRLERKQWPQAFRLQETRRMRSREIHYLDHPMFGVLILATPYVAPVEENPEETPLETEELKGINRQGGLTPPSASNPLSGAIRR